MNTKGSLSLFYPEHFCLFDFFVILFRFLIVMSKCKSKTGLVLVLHSPVSVLVLALLQESCIFGKNSQEIHEMLPAVYGNNALKKTTPEELDF